MAEETKVVEDNQNVHEEKNDEQAVWRTQETAVISQILKQVLTISYNEFILPESICNEIAQFANPEFQYECIEGDEHQIDRLIYPVELIKYAICNPFGFTIFAGIQGDTNDPFDGVILDITDILNIRFHADNDDNFKLEITLLDDEKTLYVYGYQPNQQYIVALSILKLLERKYIVMVRELSDNLEFTRSRRKEHDEENTDTDSDEESENEQDNGYQEGVLEFEVNQYFEQVMTEDTNMTIGDDIDHDYFDGTIQFMTIKIGLCEDH